MFDLEALGTVDRVEIEFYSSDEGQFGINTPLFFNLDDLTFMRSSQTNLIQGDYAFQIYPNPTQEYLRWSTDLEIEYFQLYSSAGHLLGQQKKPSENEIHVGRLPSGLYYLLAKTSEGIIRRSFIKH